MKVVRIWSDDDLMILMAAGYSSDLNSPTQWQITNDGIFIFILDMLEVRDSLKNTFFFTAVCAAVAVS